MQIQLYSGGLPLAESLPRIKSAPNLALPFISSGHHVALTLSHTGLISTPLPLTSRPLTNLPVLFL